MVTKSQNRIARSHIDTNLVVDPGFGHVKVAVLGTDGRFTPALFPSVIGTYPHTRAGSVDERTVKVTVKSSTRVDIPENSCKLVGNRANLFQSTGRLSAFMFSKVDDQIVTWMIFAAYSYIIPPGLKTIQIHKSWLGCLLQNLEETNAFKKAIAGDHVFELERVIDGVHDIVTVDLKLTEDKIFIQQEASCAIHYVLQNHLCPISQEVDTVVGNVSIGAGTVDFVRQNIVGQVIESYSFDRLGVSSLASLISTQLSASGKIKNPSTERILQSIGESNGAEFLYGRGQSAVDITDIFKTCLQSWGKNIIAQYMDLWRDDFQWIDRIFFYGGGIHHLGLDGKAPKIIFLFPKEHDPQFVDVWGAKLHLEASN